MGARIHMIGLFVEDLQNMVRFYREVMGFEIEWNGEGPYAEFTNEGVRFAMYERAQLPNLLGQQPDYTKGLNGTFELAIDLPYFDEVDVEFKRVKEAGAKPVYAPRNEPWGMRSSMIADPEGNLVEIGSWGKG